MELEEERRSNTHEPEKLYKKLESNTLHMYSKWNYFVNGITEAGTFLSKFETDEVLFH